LDRGRQNTIAVTPVQTIPPKPLPGRFDRLSRIQDEPVRRPCPGSAWAPLSDRGGSRADVPRPRIRGGRGARFLDRPGIVSTLVLETWRSPAPRSAPAAPGLVLNRGALSSPSVAWCNSPLVVHLPPNELSQCPDRRRHPQFTPLTTPNPAPATFSPVVSPGWRRFPRTSLVSLIPLGLFAAGTISREPPTSAPQRPAFYLSRPGPAAAARIGCMAAFVFRE